MIKKVIEIDVDVLNANGGIEGLSNSFKEASKETESLRSQMRKAQQEVAQLSEKFGATSKEAVQAAKRAGELKDKIGDAKALTDAFNPDAKFKSLTASLSGVAGGFSAIQGAMGLLGTENKDLERQLLKVQSAMAISTGLQALGEAKDSFVQLKAVAINAFNGIKSAIGSTGIGLIVVAIGTLYTYWDDIKEVVGGVSDEQAKLNKQSATNLDQEKKKLDTISDQDEVLKLQGKSEKDILKIKLAQTQETIKASQLQIENSIITAKAQTETAKRNQEILSGILKFLSLPLTMILKTVDLVGKAIGKDFGLEAKVFDTLSSFIFDPKKTKEEGDKVIDEQKLALKKLENQKAGYQNQINSIDKKAGEDAKAKREQDRKDELEKINASAKEIQDALEYSENEKAKKQAELKAKAKAIQDRIAEETKPEMSEREKLEAKYQMEYDLLVSANESTLALSAKHTSDLLALDKKEKDEKKANEDKLANDKRILREQELALSAQTFGKVAELLGKNSKVGKAFAIGQALVNTYQGITAQIATKPKTPYEIGLVIANVATVAAVGFKAVKSIIGTKTDGGGGGAPSIGGGAGGGGAQAPSFNVVGNAGVNQIAQTLNKPQPPIQAVVVANNVTTAQSANRNIVQNASLG